ncbi:MAG TPA: winged helix-turn-helix domain-containing protein [Candidatus Tumulicola sp.]|jgi:DNA-binding response OmpR family regulator
MISSRLPIEPAAPAASRLTTRSLLDDEVRAVADANYRSDNPLRFESVRQAALLFERAGYSICRDPQISPMAATPQAFVVGGLRVDALERTVRLADREIDLKHREFDLLAILARRPGQVFTRAQLLDLVWPRDFEGSDRTVDVHVARLRRKLGDAPGSPRILTVHGAGYKLALPERLQASSLSHRVSA